MKKILNLAIFAMLGLVFSSFTENRGRWIIDEESRLIIRGFTNVNSFSCELQHYATGDTLEYVRNAESIELKCARNRMRIPVKGFSCGNKQITKDFLHTLKSDNYPEMEIFFRCFKKDEIRDKAYIDGVVDITLAGATKRYVINYYARRPDGKTILLEGTQAVNFGDFKLDPPHAMMGLIKVQECLQVEFNLVLKAL